MLDVAVGELELAGGVHRDVGAVVAGQQVAVQASLLDRPLPQDAQTWLALADDTYTLLPRAFTFTIPTNETLPGPVHLRVGQEGRTRRNFDGYYLTGQAANRSDDQPGARPPGGSDALGVLIRAYTPADRDQVADIVLAVRAVHGWPSQVRPGNVQDAHAWVDGRDYTHRYVALEDQTVVGYLGSYRVPATDPSVPLWHAATGADAAQMVAFGAAVVHPARTTRGAGTALAATAVRDITARHLIPVTATLTRNAHVERGLAAAGFVRAGTSHSAQGDPVSVWVLPPPTWND